LDYPSGYYLPNLISVAASDRFDQPATFTNYGSHSVHIAAPGHEILSTIPGRGPSQVTENPYQDVFFDDVENGMANWTTDSLWGATTLDSFSPNTSLTDSPAGNYVNLANTAITSSTIDLSGVGDVDLRLGFFARHTIESGLDNVWIEGSGNNGQNWVQLGSITGNQSTWVFYDYAIPVDVRTNQFSLRFRLVTDGSVVYDGIYLDDIGIGSSSTSTPSGSNQYAIASGTSMAAPHVVGVLALLQAQDTARNWSQLKNLVLAGGSDVSSFSATTITGKRLRAADTDGTGSLSCNNQVVLKRLMPRTDIIALERGSNSMFNMSMLHINCDQPAGSLTATVMESGQVINLLDNGLGYDQVADDGIYSAQVPADVFSVGNLTIVLPDGENLTVSVADNYSTPESATFQWRDISAVQNPLAMGDVSWAQISSPFPIYFAEDIDGYDTVHISSKGFIALTKNGAPLSFNGNAITHTPLPTPVTSNMIAALWTDLYPGGGGSVSWGILGSQPNREFIVQWENVPLYGLTGNGVSFQIVVFENNADILFNYGDVVFGEPLVDNGAFATVGIQVLPTLARQFSFDAPSLTDQSSLLWRFFDPNINYPPVLGSLSDVAAIEGENLTFSIYASDRNGTPPILSVDALPPGAIFDPNTGVFSWTDAGPPGQYPLTFSATDANDSTISTAVTMMISIEQNFPPVFNAVSNEVVVEGGTVSFTVELEDLNAIAANFTVDGLPDGAVVTPLANSAPTQFRWQFTWTNAGPAGQYNLTFTAEDSVNTSFTDTINVMIEVQPNSPPVLQVPEDMVISQGDSIEFTISATDENHTPIVLAANNIPVGASFSRTNGMFRWPNTTLAGVYEITFTATDSIDANLVSSAVLTITVEENVAPEISVAPRFTIQTGEALTFSVTVSDGNSVAATLSARDLPEGASFDTETGEFSWSNTVTAGIYALTFVAVDSIDPALFDVETVIIEIQAPASKPDGNGTNGDSGGGGPMGLYFLLMLLISLATRIKNRRRLCGVRVN
jgi:hypothetical protein